MKMAICSCAISSRVDKWQKNKILNPSKLLAFADNNFEFDKNGRKKTPWEKEKLLVMSNFSFSQSVFKILVLQTRKNKRLFGKGFEVDQKLPSHSSFCLLFPCFKIHIFCKP